MKPNLCKNMMQVCQQELLFFLFFRGSMNCSQLHLGLLFCFIYFLIPLGGNDDEEKVVMQGVLFYLEIKESI